MTPAPDYKAIYEELAFLVKRMRYLQNRKQSLRSYFPVQERTELYKIQRKVDNILTLTDNEIGEYQKIMNDRNTDHRKPTVQN